MLRGEHAAVTWRAVNPPMARVLVIDGDPHRRHALAAALETERHEVSLAANARDGVRAAATAPPELVVVESVLDDATSATVCTTLRREAAAREVLLLVISPSASEDDRVAAFEAGADDYVTRPFSVRELQLRVRALLRRAVSRAPVETIDIGPIRIDRGARRVTDRGVAVALTRREFDLLIHLVDARGRVLARDAIVGDLWRGDDRSERVVDTTLKRLRNKLPSIAPRIRTIRGVGYELTSDEGDSQ